MLTFIADESHVGGKIAEDYGLSIYGGLIVNKETFKYLTDFVYSIKERYHFLNQKVELKWRFADVLLNMRKFNLISVDIKSDSNKEAIKTLKEDYDQLKNEILDFVADSDAKIVVAIRPNRLLKATPEKVIEYSLGAVTRKFESLLNREKDVGIILADEIAIKRFEGHMLDYEYILNLYSDSHGASIFNNIINIVPTICSHLSPVHQINDIVLGAIQYYILEFIRTLKYPGHDMTLARDIFLNLVENFYKSRGGQYIINNGILLYPPKNSRGPSKAGTFLDKLELRMKSDFNII